MQKCLNDDNDQSDFRKSALIEEIQEAMENALVINSNPESQDVGDDSDDTLTVPAAIDQREVIDTSLRNVIGLEIHLNQLQESAFLTSEQIYQAKSALFTLRHVLQSRCSAITSENIQNSRQITLFDFNGLNDALKY
ncbi:hypothetical protein R1flu_007599 [Riccia fluitans]|uniref:Uncharacterized protein n=1 Tax=Riccia fluitans TaxID=41844 RepID=A0ABD1YZL4_9MARC